MTSHLPPASAAEIAEMDPRAFLTPEAVKHLELSGPGGFWTVTDQKKGLFTISYSHNGGQLFYSVYTCTGTEDVRRFCQPYTYEYIGGPIVVAQPDNHPAQDVGSTVAADHHATQLPVHPQPQVDNTLAQGGDAQHVYGVVQVPANFLSQGVSQLGVAAQHNAVMQQSATDQGTGNDDWTMTNLPAQTNDETANVNDDLMDDGNQNYQGVQPDENGSTAIDWDQMPDMGDDGAHTGWDMMFSNP
ncbi:Fc.00g036580.m01.CDS01 [Cosmosporella sp. VM-42]